MSSHYSHAFAPVEEDPELHDMPALEGEDDESDDDEQRPSPAVTSHAMAMPASLYHEPLPAVDMSTISNGGTVSWNGVQLGTYGHAATVNASPAHHDAYVNRDVDALADDSDDDDDREPKSLARTHK